jgi:hypothetical protein
LHNGFVIQSKFAMSEVAFILYGVAVSATLNQKIAAAKAHMACDHIQHKR